MKVYAYAICAPGTAVPPPRTRGLSGAALRALRRDRLAMVYSRHRSLRAEPSRQALLAHERVVEAVMARGPVLPLRFGMQLEDEAALATVLAERAEQFLHALERVRGRLELGLRAIPERGAGAHAEAPSGRAYVQALMRERRRAEQAARDLHDPLAALACASRVWARPAPPAILTAAYLVEPDRIPEFRSRAGELSTRRDDLQVVLTGPWPPYSFAGEDTA